MDGDVGCCYGLRNPPGHYQHTPFRPTKTQVYVNINCNPVHCLDCVKRAGVSRKALPYFNSEKWPEAVHSEK